MSWRKHFKIWDPTSSNNQMMSVNPQDPRQQGRGVHSSKWNSYLAEVYTVQPNRTDRYTQYDQMDQDSEINAALDTIAEFCTQFDENKGVPFELFYKQDPTEAEQQVLEKSLNQWCNINDWDKRIWRVVRSTLKYGDQFFVRDPETYELLWINPADMVKIIINDSKGRETEQYVMRNLALNMIDKTATSPVEHQTAFTSMVGMSKSAPVLQNFRQGSPNGSNISDKEFAVDASHIMQLSLSEGMDSNWPFGTSVLEPIFKIYKQKELLEDSIIIYRVQRAPERRVFYIDVGNMPSHMAMAFVERVKNEIHQRRIPTRSGGGATVMDSSYNPLSMLEDYFFAQTSEGRGSKVEVLPGGDNLGQIDDLKFFTNKMMRALRIPSSYMPTGPDDGTAVYNDGKVGTAYIQEYRFNKYCQRMQNLLCTTLDHEFKMFLKWKGVEIDSGVFDLRFIDPQSFSEYRDIELNSNRLQAFSQVAETSYLSRRFVLEKYLGLTKEEIKENERMWKEENPGGAAGASLDAETSNTDLASVGIRQPNLTPLETKDLENSLGAAEENPTGTETAPVGAVPAGAEAPPPGGAGI
jgi:hypothetical protein